MDPARRGLFLLLDLAAYTSEQFVAPIFVALVAALVVEPVCPSVPVASRVVRGGGGDGLVQGQSARARTPHLSRQVARVPFHLPALLQGDPLPPRKGLVLETVRVVRRKKG